MDGVIMANDKLDTIKMQLKEIPQKLRYYIKRSVTETTGKRFIGTLKRT